jgi:hypothetical protein
MAAITRISAPFTGHAIAGHTVPFEVKASPEKLKEMIQAKGANVLNCKFKEGFQTYSPLEYAVKIRDTKSAQALIGFGADVEDSPLTHGTLVHFYIGCLSEHAPPNLDMLNLLLDHTDVNKEEVGCFRNALECALEHMKPYKKMHLDVIEILLKRGSRVEDTNGITPLMYLIVPHKYDSERRLSDKTQAPRCHLADYLALEKKYHPETDIASILEKCGLSESDLEEKQECVEDVVQWLGLPSYESL